MEISVTERLAVGQLAQGGKQSGALCRGQSGTIGDAVLDDLSLRVHARRGPSRDFYLEFCQLDGRVFDAGRAVLDTIHETVAGDQGRGGRRR